MLAFSEALHPHRVPTDGIRSDFLSCITPLRPASSLMREGTGAWELPGSSQALPPGHPTLPHLLDCCLPCRREEFKKANKLPRHQKKNGAHASTPA